MELLVKDYTSKYEDKVMLQINSLKNDEKYDDAVSYLDEVIKELPNSFLLKEARDELISLKPISLSKAIVIDSKLYDYHPGLFKDNFGNEYLESYSFTVRGDILTYDYAYAIYNVEKYSKFNAYIVCGSDTNSETIFQISFYINDETAPIKVISNYTKKTGKEHISLDLNNVNKLMIKVDFAHYSSFIRIVNATLSN